MVDTQSDRETTLYLLLGDEAVDDDDPGQTRMSAKPETTDEAVWLDQAQI